MWARLVNLLGRLPQGWRTLIETCLVGLAAGLAAVAFQAGIDALGKSVYAESHWASPWAFMAGSLGVICSASLLTGFLLHRLCPEAAGSGIPQLKLAFGKDFGHLPPRIAVVKFVAGVIGIGGGSAWAGRARACRSVELWVPPSPACSEFPSREGVRR